MTNPTDVVFAVAQHYGLTVDTLLTGKSDNDKTPRQVAMYLVNEHCPGLSSDQLHAVFGRPFLDVLHSVRAIQLWVAVNPAARLEVEAARWSVETHLTGDADDARTAGLRPAPVLVDVIVDRFRARLDAELDRVTATWTGLYGPGVDL